MEPVEQINPKSYIGLAFQWLEGKHQCTNKKHAHRGWAPASSSDSLDTSSDSDYSSSSCKSSEDDSSTDDSAASSASMDTSDDSPSDSSSSGSSDLRDLDSESSTNSHHSCQHHHGWSHY
ncbi:hypothetical protein ID866_11543 [Astraeus odoratus]|nr:hypothetical protein ID866_11543 [Astraeus odoratus]